LEQITKIGRFSRVN